MDKLKKISSMEDEVNEFHPFLKNLLPKLPNVKHLEYTHGNSEYGSDFVIVNEDVTLLQESYIGVVVKTKKIQQNDIENIQRQINESFKMPKIIFNGKRKVSLNGVWYITNKAITNNAKEKIVEYFENKNISFIDIDHIIMLIDKNYSEYWHNMTLNVSTHNSKIRAKVEEEDNRYTLLPNLDPNFYIEPEIKRIDEDEYRFKENKNRKDKSIDIKKVIESEKIILLEAQMGFGKSKLIRHLIKYYTDPTIYEEKKILIFPLKYSELFADDIFEVEKLYGFCETCSDEIDDHNKCVFMIDGFDEKDETLHEKNENLQKIIDFTNNNDRFTIFIASRRFKEYTNTDKDNNKLKRYQLEGLTLNKILKFLEQLCKELNIKNRIIEDIKRSSLFKELPNSPIAAILLARLFENNSKDLPANLPELYSMYIELVLGKWDVDKGLESLKEYEVIQAILIRISYYFIDNQCDYLTFKDYEDIVQKYLDSRNLEFTFDRMDFLMTKRSGVLVKDLKAGIINYSHRSFIEFMYAKGKSINNDLVVTEKAFNLTWQNIYYFYIGIKKDCKDFLIDIINLEPSNEAEEWFRLINLSNYFLAAHATPYVFFKENLYKIFIEAATLYVEKTLLQKNSIFSKLPQLIALWWVQLLIKENYAYDFFKNALEDTTLVIDDLELDEDVKMYALFFLGTVGLRLEIFEPFKYLLSKYKEKLPSDITIGIMNEIKIENVNNRAIMKSKKWLDRRASRMHKMLIKELTEEPIYKQKQK